MNLHCDESCADHDECEYEHNPNLCWQKAVDSGMTLEHKNEHSIDGRNMVVTMPDLGYEIRPYSNGLCYELFKWRDEYQIEKGKRAGETVSAGWVSLNWYPTTLQSALVKVLELSLMDNKDTVLLAQAVKNVDMVYESIQRMNVAPQT